MADFPRAQTHALVLQGSKYSTELEIYADGYQLRLIDPYNAPSLRIRYAAFALLSFSGRPADPRVTAAPRATTRRSARSPPTFVPFSASGYVRRTDFQSSQDPYFGELQAFIDACDPSASSAIANDDDMEILSTFDDSVKSYAL